MPKVRLDGVDAIHSQNSGCLEIDEVVAKLDPCDLTNGESIPVAKLDNSTLQGGQVLAYNQSSGKWNNTDITAAGSAVNNDLGIARTGTSSDVSIEYNFGNSPNTTFLLNGTNANVVSIQDGDTLSWDAATSKWINGPPTGGGVTVDLSNYYTKTEVDSATDKTNYYTKTQVDAQISSNLVSSTAGGLEGSGIRFTTDGTDNFYDAGLSAEVIVLSINTPQNGEALVYQGGQWVNSAVSGGGGSGMMGVDVVQAGGDTDYVFNAGTSVSGIDTSGLSDGATVFWNSATQEWKVSSLIIEEI